MADAAVAGAPDVPNHPLALRMGIIAAMSHNIIIGTVFGTAGVLLKPMQERMQVTPEMSSAGVPLVILGSAILASVAGVLAARHSLRMLMALSAAAAACAWLILAFSTSYALYVVAYGLLLGPAMALAGAVLPPTLVTRWFNRNRGLAIGLVHLPIVVTILPIATNWIIQHYGIQAAFLVLAALCGLVLLPASLLVIDHPPGEAPHEAVRAPAEDGASSGGFTIGQLLRHPQFWALSLAVCSINTSSTLLGVHLVAMGESWGFSRDSSAVLPSVMAMMGIVGSVLFGLVADRLGGARTLALIVFDAGVLWLAFLAGLPFPVLLVVVGLIGMHGSGSIPSLSRSLTDALGPESFSRAYGLAATVTLPLTVIGVLGTGTIYRLNGNYHLAVFIMVAYFAISVPLALYGGRGNRKALTPLGAG